MSRNKLCLNPHKTEFLIIGNARQCSKISLDCLDFSGSSVPVSASARNLGFIFDSSLSFSNQISAVSKSCFFHIRQLRRIRPSLNHDTAVLLANSLVSSKLDFCNSLYYGLPESSIHRLQLIQNALIRGVFPGVRKLDHISAYRRRLHWLPVEQRITYKLATLTFKALDSGSPYYFSELLRPIVHSSRNLRSNDLSLLSVPRLNSVAGRRSFAFSGPTIWNSLPLELRQCRSFAVFCAKLKTHLFPP